MPPFHGEHRLDECCIIGVVSWFPSTMPIKHSIQFLNPK
jgi:hypothetical protein